MVMDSIILLPFSHPQVGIQSGTFSAPGQPGIKQPVTDQTDRPGK